MPRFRTTPTIALFPFLSVLMCAVGLMVVVFACGSLFSLLSAEKKFTLIMDSDENMTPRPWDDRQQPVYVLCSGDGLRVFYSTTRIEGISYNSASPSPMAETSVRNLVQFLTEQAGRRWAVLLVRPSGIDQMRDLRGRLDRQGLVYGRWPFGESTSFRVEARTEQPP